MTTSISTAVEDLVDTTKSEFSGSPVWRLHQRPNVYFDCGVYDPASREFLFGRFWGRDAAINNLIASLYLPEAEGGLTEIRITSAGKDGEDSGHVWRIENPKNFDKFNGRVPQGLAPEFANLSWVWVYHKKLLQPDLALQESTLLLEKGLFETKLENYLWQLTKNLSSIPLQDHWREYIMAQLNGKPNVITHLGYVGDVVRAVKLSLPPNFEDMICLAIQQQEIQPVIH